MVLTHNPIVDELHELISGAEHAERHADFFNDDAVMDVAT